MQNNWDIKNIGCKGELFKPSYQTCGRKLYVFGWRLEAQCLQQSDNLAIATHDGGVNQCNKVVASLKNIQQINIEKVKSFLPQVKGAESLF